MTFLLGILTAAALQFISRASTHAQTVHREHQWGTMIPSWLQPPWNINILLNYTTFIIFEQLNDCRETSDTRRTMQDNAGLLFLFAICSRLSQHGHILFKKRLKAERRRLENSNVFGIVVVTSVLPIISLQCYYFTLLYRLSLMESTRYQVLSTTFVEWSQAYPRKALLMINYSCTSTVETVIIVTLIKDLIVL